MTNLSDRTKAENYSAFFTAKFFANTKDGINIITRTVYYYCIFLRSKGTRLTTCQRQKHIQMQHNIQQDPAPINLNYFLEHVDAQINNGKRINWVFNDSNCYRVTIQKTEEGNLTTQPINGALATLNIHSGQLFLKVIHSSIWNAQRGLSKSRERAAEELAALIRALPIDLHPRTIFITRASITTFQNHLIDFPEIQLHGCTFFLPLSALLRIKKIEELINTATEPQLVVFNLYEDWEPIAPAAAFRRLIMMLQALRLDATAALDIIDPEKEKSETLWPKMSPEEWIQIEIQLKKLIVDRFAKTADSLTDQQIEEAIYGEDVQEAHQLQQ